ncbi:alpha/beta hydrolase [Bryobacter aggregatus]|uniref:alpha/beta hydrolase n=1 Tax=Bryobacter aggregatus TaxID=360054 RepID=UPI00068ABDCF|nr:alpha/beta hydrolase [Bryobacter aggregatus]
MKLVIHPSIALTILASALSAQLPSPAPEIAGKIEEENHYPNHEVTFANGVSGFSNLVYAQPLGYRPLSLDLYLPPKTLPRADAGHPLIVFLHGGGWMDGDPQRSGAFVDFPSVLASLAEKGYVVASIEYRLSGEAIFPAQLQDAKAAIRWLRSQASLYGIDPSRAMAWGVAAGGHLAALLGVSCHVAALASRSNASDPSDCVQGSVVWSGVFDMATIAVQARAAKALSRDTADAPEWRLLGCFAGQCQKGQLAAASPVTYLDPKDPPMLLIVGEEDKTIPALQSLEMAEKLRAFNLPHELIVIPEVGQGFIGKSLAKTREANLKALAATFRFINQTMNQEE